MRLIKKVNEFLFPKRISGKEWIDREMTQTWGPNWLEECLEGLKNEEVRKQLKKDLKL